MSILTTTAGTFNGIVESTTGGVKFPNASVQTIAANGTAAQVDIGTTSGTIPLLQTAGVLAQARLPVISDTIHGNRGGGSIHNAATSSTPGFLPAADKKKLDQIYIPSALSANLLSAQSDLPTVTQLAGAVNRTLLNNDANRARKYTDYYGWTYPLWVGDIFPLPFHNYRGSPPYPAGGYEALACSFPQMYGKLLVWEWDVNTYVDGTNNGSNYWEVRLLYYQPAIGVSAVSIFDTSTYPDSAWVITQQGSADFTVDPMMDGTTSAIAWVQIYVNALGTPGDLYFVNTVMAREAYQML